MLRMYPTADIVPSMKAVLFAATLPPGVKAGRSLMIPKPVQRLFGARPVSQCQPVMRLGDIEIRPLRQFLETAIGRTQAGPARREKRAQLLFILFADLRRPKGADI